MKTRMWLALFSVYIFWGSTYLAIRFAVESIPPFLLASARFLMAGVILYCWRRLSGDARPRGLHWCPAAIIGLLLLLGGNGLVVWAEQYVESGIAALLIGSVPLWMVLLDALRPGGVRPSGLALVGFAIGLGGVALLIGPALFAGQADKLVAQGLGALILAAFLWSLGSLYSRRASLPDSPLLGTAMEMLAGGLGLLIVGSILGDWRQLDITLVSSKSLMGLLYLIIFGSLIAFAAYNWLLRVAPTPVVATYAYVNPLIAVLLGSLLAQEAFTARILLAAVIIIGSVVLINIVRTPPRQGIAKLATTK